VSSMPASARQNRHPMVRVLSPTSWRNVNATLRHMDGML